MYCTAGAVHKIFFKNCPKPFWELSMYCTAGAVFKNFFSKTVPHTPGSCQCIAPQARCTKFFFKKCPTKPTFVVQVVFKLLKLFDFFA